MKKKLCALLLSFITCGALITGCTSDNEEQKKDEEIQTLQDEGGYDVKSLSIDTNDFDEAMDAYKDYYNEFCEENLKPYYEDHSDCDCAARFVVNPDDNKVMMVIADIVDCAGDEMKVNIYFFEYSGGEVKEYLSIPSIWTSTDGIYVGNILNDLYVSTTSYPDGSQYEHIQYRIANGKAEEITQTTQDDEEWIDVNTEKGVIGYPLPYDLSGRIFTDCDSYANKYCVSERNFEESIDYLKENVPATSNELKVLWVNYLVENRITSKPDISADAYEYEDFVQQIEIYEEREKESSDIQTLDSIKTAVECYFAENGLPSDITEVMVEQHDGKVYIDSSVDISEYLGLSSTSEGISFESEEWEPFTLTYSLSTNNWSLSPENAGALYYDALGNHLKDNSSEENNSNNGGEAAETSAVEGADTADAGSATTSSSSVDDEIFQKYKDSIDPSDIFESNECFFVDVDGNGTPELIAYLGNRIPLMYYINSEGNVEQDGITGLIEGGGKTCCYYSEGDGWGVSFSRLENGQLISEYSIYIGGDIMNPTLANYYHDGVCDEVSEQEAESLSNTDAYTDLWNYTSYSSLLDAWEAYNN